MKWKHTKKLYFYNANVTHPLTFLFFRTWFSEFLVAHNFSFSEWNFSKNVILFFQFWLKTNIFYLCFANFKTNWIFILLDILFSVYCSHPHTKCFIANSFTGLQEDLFPKGPSETMRLFRLQSSRWYFTWGLWRYSCRSRKFRMSWRRPII